MNNRYIMSLVAAPMVILTLALPAYAADGTAPTTCKDGTTSATVGKGACSGHGGVQKAPKTSTKKATETAATAAPAAAPAATTTKTSAPKTATTTSASSTDPSGCRRECADRHGRCCRPAGRAIRAASPP